MTNIKYLKKTPFFPISQAELHANIFSLIAVVGPFGKAMCLPPSCSSSLLQREAPMGHGPFWGVHSGGDSCFLKGKLRAVLFPLQNTRSGLKPFQTWVSEETLFFKGIGNPAIFGPCRSLGGDMAKKMSANMNRIPPHALNSSWKLKSDIFYDFSSLW